MSPLSNAQSGPTKLNISGVLYTPLGEAVLNSSVNFKIEIWDKNSTCILYSEEHLGVDLSAAKGGFAMQIGSGSSISNRIDGTSATALSALVFKNPGVVAPFTDCAGGVTLASGDERLIRVYYDLGSGFIAMSPDIPVTSSAYAVVAETLEGKKAADFVQVRDDATYDLNQTNVETIFSAVNFAKLVQILSGNWGNTTLTNVGTPSAGTDATNKNYVDANIGGKIADVTTVGPAAGNGHTLIWDQGLNKWVTGAPTATDNTKLPLAGGTMTGAIAMGTQNITNIGHITMAAQRTLNLGTYDNAQETVLVGTLGVGDKGKIWFNSQTNVFKVWNGTAAVDSATPSGSAGGDLTGTYPNPTIANSAVTSAKINNTGIGVNRLLITDAATGANVTYKTCGLNESLMWTATGWDCVTAASSVTTGGGFINNGNSLGAAATIGTNDNFALNFEANNSTAMTILPSGNVGIGTSGPNAKLEVGITARASAYDAQSASTWADLMITNPTDTLSAATGIKFLIDGSGDSSTAGAGIAAVKTHGTGYAADLAFIVDPNGASNFEAMRVVSSGNVGIGTTNPNQRLTVEGPMSLRAQAAPTLTANYGKIYVDSGDSNKLKYMNPAGAITDLTTAGGTGGWTDSGATISTTTASDSVGIGGSPSYKLDVVGDINSSTAYRLGGVEAIKFVTGPYGGAQANVFVGTAQSHSSVNTAAADRNVAVGTNAGSAISNNGENTFVGFAAGQSSTGNQNTFLGNHAAYSATTGDLNIAIGAQTSTGLLSGTSNVVVGSFANGSNETGNRNVILGTLAAGGNAAVSGEMNENIAIGYAAGFVMEGGTAGNGSNGNILIGHQAGNTITTGDRNILLGFDIDTPAATTSNFMSLGNIIFATGVSGTGTTVSSANVGIGTASPGTALTVNGPVALKAPSTINAATYTVAASDSSLIFTTTNCTLTLPAAATFPGRILYVKNITAHSVTSASSNVVPLASAAAGTSILAATAGKFAMLQSDGTNWIVMMSN